MADLPSHLFLCCSCALHFGLFVDADTREVEVTFCPACGGINLVVTELAREEFQASVV